MRCFFLTVYERSCLFNSKPGIKSTALPSSNDGNCGNFQRDNCCKIRNQRRNYPAENKIATSSSATKNKRASCVGFSTILGGMAQTTVWIFAIFIVLVLCPY